MRSLIAIIFFVFNLSSCQTNKDTPNDYISNVSVPQEVIKRDSLTLVNLIKDEIKVHSGDYFPQYYDKNTEIIIDTIMYNDKFDRLVFFIIDKVENKKKFNKDISEEQIKELEKYGSLPYEGYHYNAHAYIGIRKNSTLKVENFFRISIGDYDSINDLRERQRKVFFQEYSSIKEKGHEYNLNDKRFWSNTNVWNKLINN